MAPKKNPGEKSAKQADKAKNDKKVAKNPPSKAKLVIIGGSILLLVIACAALSITISAQPSGSIICDKIQKAKEMGIEAIEEKYNWLDVNMCRESSCTFDTDTCDAECPFGYELDANNCPVSCECVPDTQGSFQGDLQISEGEMEDYLSKFGYMDEEKEFEVFASSSVEKRTKLWNTERYMSDSTKFEVPYAFDDQMNTHLGSRTIKAAEAAIREVESRISCLKFVKHDDPQGSYILFTRRSGCWSGVGKIPFHNEISLGVGCNDPSTIKHMIYHRLGFQHEHSRPDRDNYVTINYANMKRSRRYNFKKLKAGRVRETNSQYDLKSLVHLHGMAMSNNGQPTIVEKATGQAVRGQAPDFSPEDIKELNYIYCNAESDEIAVSGGSSSGGYPSPGTYPSSSGFPSPSGYPPSGSGFPSPSGNISPSGDTPPSGSFPPTGYSSPTGYPSPSVYPSSGGYPSSGFPSPSLVGYPSPTSSSTPPADSSQWGSWGPYTPCTVTCGDGTKSSVRECPVKDDCVGVGNTKSICHKPACSSSGDSYEHNPYSPYGPSGTYGAIPVGSPPSSGPSAYVSSGTYGATPVGSPPSSGPSIYGSLGTYGATPVGSPPSSGPSIYGSSGTYGATPVGSPPSSGPSIYGSSGTYGATPVGSPPSSGPSIYGATPVGSPPSSGPSIYGATPVGSPPSSGPSAYVSSGTYGATPVGSPPYSGPSVASLFGSFSENSDEPSSSSTSSGSPSSPSSFQSYSPPASPWGSVSSKSSRMYESTSTGWGSWSPFSSCNRSCGPSWKTKKRVCNSGSECRGTASKIRFCVKPYC
ncbi:uncharacterized protein LOC120336391 [Styela clava]